MFPTALPVATAIRSAASWRPCRPGRRRPTRTISPAARTDPRTAVKATDPISAPTSRTPEKAVTAVLVRRSTTPLVTSVVRLGGLWCALGPLRPGGRFPPLSNHFPCLRHGLPIGVRCRRTGREVADETKVVKRKLARATRPSRGITATSRRRSPTPGRGGGAGINNAGQDAQTWSDHTDVRPTPSSPCSGSRTPIATTVGCSWRRSMPMRSRSGCGSPGHLARPRQHLQASQRAISRPVRARQRDRVDRRPRQQRAERRHLHDAPSQGRELDLTARARSRPRWATCWESAAFKGQALDEPKALGLIAQAQGLLAEVSACATDPLACRTTVGSSLVAAVLPSGRSVQVGTAATAFATVWTPVAGLPHMPSAFARHVHPRELHVPNDPNPGTNQVTGAPNTPVDIPPGGSQTSNDRHHPLRRHFSDGNVGVALRPSWPAPTGEPSTRSSCRRRPRRCLTSSP